MRERLTVSMSLNRRAWMPGDIVRGTMRINLNEPLIVQSGSLTLYCLENVYFLYQSNEYSSKTNSYVHHKQVLQLRPASTQVDHIGVVGGDTRNAINNFNDVNRARGLHQADNVNNNPNQDTQHSNQGEIPQLSAEARANGWCVWKEGLHLWNFLFVLPPDLPPTFIVDTMNYCKVLLETRLVVKPILNDIEGAKVTTLVGLTNIQIIPFCPLMMSLITPPPLRPNEYKTNSNIIIGATMEQNRTILTPASTLNLRYTINNVSRKRTDVVHSIIISLRRRTILRDCKMSSKYGEFGRQGNNQQQQRRRMMLENDPESAPTEISYGTAYVIEEILHEHSVTGLSIKPGQRSNEKQCTINLATIPTIADIPSSPSLNLNYLTSDIIDEIKENNSVTANYMQVATEENREIEAAEKNNFFKNIIKSVSKKITNITGNAHGGRHGKNLNEKESYGEYNTSNDFIIGGVPNYNQDNIIIRPNGLGRIDNNNGNNIANEGEQQNIPVRPRRETQDVYDSILDSAINNSIALGMIISGGSAAKSGVFSGRQYYAPPGLFNKLISVDYYLKIQTNKIGWCFGKGAELMIPIVIYPHNEIRAPDIGVLDPENSRRIEAAILNLALLESLRDSYQIENQFSPQIGAFDVIENSMPSRSSSLTVIKELLKIVPEDPLYSINKTPAPTDPNNNDG